MAEEPEIIRERIEETREQMGDTLDALAAKTDVKGRAKDWVSDKKDAVVGAAKDAASKVTGAGQGVMSTVGDKTPDGEQLKRAVRRTGGMARENPLGLAIGAAAFGFIVGLVVPTTNVEHEKLGPAADQVKDRVRELGHEAIDRGKEVAKEAVSSATEAAKEAGSEQAQQLKESAQEKTEQITSGVSGSA
jgi:gas vesicle protein